MKRKLILVGLVCFVLQLISHAQNDESSVKPALLIIDIQNFYFPGEGPGLVNAEPASEVAKDVLQLCRSNKIPVIHVRHDSKKGFDIHKNVEPLPHEKVITKTEVNCFKGTDLLAYLKENQINRLILIGMQTQMCLEAAVRAGHDFGFDCIVVQDACATRNLNFEGITIEAADVHASTLASLRDGGYARIIRFDELKTDSLKYLHQKAE